MDLQVDGERDIIFHPDFVECGHIYRTNPVVKFLSSCIEVKCPASSRDEEEFYLQLRLDDITDIESWWIGMVLFQCLLITSLWLRRWIV